MGQMSNQREPDEQIPCWILRFHSFWKEQTERQQRGSSMQKSGAHQTHQRPLFLTIQLTSWKIQPAGAFICTGKLMSKAALKLKNMLSKTSKSLYYDFRKTVRLEYFDIFQSAVNWD